MDLERYKAQTGRLDVTDIDFEAFASEPLSADALRCLRYMHDIENHTACYLRDLLMTPAHKDPDITTFLSCWNFEETWHGEALARVLAAHGELPEGAWKRCGSASAGRIASHPSPISLLPPPWGARSSRST